MITTRSVLAKATLIALPLALALGAPAAAFAAPAPTAPTTSTRTITADAGAGHSVPGIGARTGETSRCTRATGWSCITSPYPPVGTVGVPFSYQITLDTTQIDGGATVAVVGALPDGLSFDSASRMITGTPTKAGNFGLRLDLTDGAGTVRAESALVIAEATTTIACPSTINTRVDRSEYFSCSTNQPSRAGTWAVDTTISALPPGMHLGETGEIYGTPTAAGTYQALVTYTTPTSSAWTWVTFNVGRSLRGAY
ncbi:putative Ig domain-containing protein [Cnuibacter physcomitrellae]|uniref:putative Ig domain-containing protein n=1 Tax=Cnuibacter physcomitrellae TaxID=1619308 RepID=UPI002175E807|nr:putative Ig domain-containing protein [Cnuibacter physcomitrellae]MCS5497611.1 putative Ig domain-containing protein [Cnuibacter physcomitrellae]